MSIPIFNKKLVKQLYSINDYNVLVSCYLANDIRRK